MSNLLTSMFSKLLKVQNDDQKGYKMQTFTFYIPSPPARTTGYREKHFDKLFYEFINRGYKIINFTTQAAPAGEKHSGMWVICLVQATNAEAEKLSLDDIFMDQLKNRSQVKEEIEGLYYIDDKASEL